jgi:oligoribonuclease
MEHTLPILAFLDLETTGLDPTSDAILEIGIVLTDWDLNVLATFHRVACWPEITYDVTTQEYDVPFGVHDSVVKMHHKNNLWAESYRSTKDFATCLREASFWLGQQLYETNASGLLPHLAGNSIWFDREFLAIQDWKFVKFFHHRLVDVSTLRTLYEPWVMDSDGPVEPMPGDGKDHRAIPDCHDSINKLRFFRRKLFNA